MNNEVRTLHETVWPLFYPEDLWLSSPANLARADRKLGQLLLARAIGFNVPETVVSSDWESLSAILRMGNEVRIVVKMMRGVISNGNKIKAMPTTILDKYKISDLAIVHHHSRDFTNATWRRRASGV
jgi:hypothetical protein